MLDVYFGNMDGVEVHAETPEEEQEAAFILNSALSGKTTILRWVPLSQRSGFYGEQGLPADAERRDGFVCYTGAGCGRYTRAGNLLHYSE